MATTETIARYSREHNGANVLTLGASLLTADEARAIVAAWLGDADARTTLHSAAEQDSRPGAAVVTPSRAAAADRASSSRRCRRPRAAPRSRCSCHAVAQRLLPGSAPGCPRARERRASGFTPPAARRPSVAALIDHTLLKPDATRQEIDELCREAAQFGFATVCVNPAWVAHAARRLAGQLRPASVRWSGSRSAPPRRRQGLRNPPRHLRRRPRDRHGHQYRRSQVGRSPHGRARHRSGRRDRAGTAACSAR